MVNSSWLIVNWKKIFFVILLTIISYQLSIKPAEGHLAGQPPFFKVNGAYANLYFVPLTSLSNFQLPQDMPSGKYLVNSPLVFELDVARLPNANPQNISQTTFTWNFGDGSEFSGLKTSHTYTKMGSYILTITAFDNTTPTPQLLESALINVLPNPDYQLPKAVITVNGRQSQDPLTDILQFQLGTKLHFDASLSKGQIISYWWDFGDQKSSTQKTVDHYYPGDLTQVFPVLRVKDNQGFISDSFVEVQNSSQGNFVTNSPKPVAKKVVSTSQLPIVLLVTGLLILVTVMARWFVRGRRHGRHQ